MNPLRLLLVLGLLLGSLVFGQDLRIYFLNVGQGDSILVITPDGKSMVYDGGRNKDRAADLITGYGVTRLDLAVASHADADHIGGLEGIALRLKPKVFLNNGIPATTQVYQRVLQAMIQVGAQGIVVSERVISLGNSVKLQVFNTPPGMGADDQNAHSIGVLLQYGAFRAFFGGDSESNTEQGWLSLYRPLLGNLDVYKAAHHGSKSNDIPEFLNWLRPQDVVIGVGTPNAYGHPTPEALALYQSVRAGIWRTDQNGTVLINVKADGSYTVAPQTGDIVSRISRGALATNPPTPNPTPTPTPNPTPNPTPTPNPIPNPPNTSNLPNLTGTLLVLGQTFYVYDGLLPIPLMGGTNPTLVSTVFINGVMVYIYDGPAPTP